jgi:hypothetical protein
VRLAEPVMVNCPTCKRLNFTYPQPDESPFVSSMPCKWCGEEVNRPTDSEIGPRQQTPTVRSKAGIAR